MSSVGNGENHDDGSVDAAPFCCAAPLGAAACWVAACCTAAAAAAAPAPVPSPALALGAPAPPASLIVNASHFAGIVVDLDLPQRYIGAAHLPQHMLGDVEVLHQPQPDLATALHRGMHARILVPRRLGGAAELGEVGDN